NNNNNKAILTDACVYAAMFGVISVRLY
ncbi:hypothetical protein LCGC14_2007070, partial [marine sediment metagenome]